MMEKRIIKISLLGIPYSGKKTYFEKLMEKQILESLSISPSFSLYDVPFHFQAVRISDAYLLQNPRFNKLYDKTIFIQWYSGPTSFATLLLEMLLRDCNGILFMVDPTPGKLEANLQSYGLLDRYFPAFHQGSLPELPLVICYNHSDRFHQKLPSHHLENSKDLLLPDLDSNQTLVERPATLTEEKYLKGINEKLNLHHHPFFATSAFYGYNIEIPFLTLLERFCTEKI